MLESAQGFTKSDDPHAAWVDPSLAALWERYFAGDYAAVVALAEATTAPGGASLEMLHVSGLALLHLGQSAAAERRLRLACTLVRAPPVQALWYSNVVVCALDTGAMTLAAAFAADGVQHCQDYAPLWFNAGNVWMRQGRLDQAEAAFQRALGLVPDDLATLLNLGNCLRRQRRLDAALTLYDRVLAQAPDHDLAFVNRISLLAETGQHDAMRALLPAMAGHLINAEASFLFSLLLLADGDYAAGWRHYRQRWGIPAARGDRARFRLPLADTLADLHGRHVLLEHEQGFGDTLQFCRYAPLLLPHAGAITLRVPTALCRLMGTLHPAIRVIAEDVEPEGCTVCVPLLDAPYLLGTTLDSIPAALPYLHLPAPPAAATFGLPEGPRRVGLVWAGKARDEFELRALDARRSLPLAAFFGMVIPGIAWVSLQMDEPAQQPPPPGFVLHAPLRPGFDFYDTAQVIQTLDLVIAVDTAVAHLAAALGKPVWLLNRHDRCWRWLRNRRDSPWYPEVMRLYTQPAPGDWYSLLAEVAADLRVWAAG